MADQCNTCGGFEHVAKCSHCATLICEHCKRNHEPVCEQMQKRKRRGEWVLPSRMSRKASIAEGMKRLRPRDPTAIISTPAVLGAPYDLSKPSLDHGRGDETDGSTTDCTVEDDSHACATN